MSTRYYINSPETYSSESSLINAFWSTDDSKTIENVIEIFTDLGPSRSDVISMLKSQFVNINDWSI
tara:strand:- start:1293 stop:1490 length:198 start_codon:yes stop_codon:yes gene_type:complete